MKGTKVFYRLTTKEMRENPISMFSSDGITFTPNVTHVQVALCPSEWSKEEIFEYFNIGKGINESFARKVRDTPDLSHTSMSVGDVVMTEDNRVFVCADCGWNELICNSPDFREIWR